MSQDSLAYVALKGGCLGLWVAWLHASRARKARRIAAGLPSMTERLGWQVARYWHDLRH
jgi:hypothetical protein